jgi:hypothetical protein
MLFEENIFTSKVDIHGNPVCPLCQADRYLLTMLFSLIPQYFLFDLAGFKA